jgi:hypothetical protein
LHVSAVMAAIRPGWPVWKVNVERAKGYLRVPVGVRLPESTP